MMQKGRVIKMKIKRIKPNVTEIELSEGNRVLFSYYTPVAHTYLTPEGRVYYRTETKWSNTTQKHINSWLPKNLAEDRPQEYFDNLMEGK